MVQDSSKGELGRMFLHGILFLQKPHLDVLKIKTEKSQVFRQIWCNGL